MILTEYLAQGVTQMIQIKDFKERETFYKNFRKEMKYQTTGATQHNYLDQIDCAYEKIAGEKPNLLKRLINYFCG